MPYSTTLQFSQRTGLATRVIDENVGTGDNSATAYDLDNDNIIASSYSLGHAPSGSNAFTALTETTHYTLDAESGRITLVAAGVTALGTDILYAHYSFVKDYSNTVISNLIDEADDEIDLLTGRRWETATSVVEYIDGDRKPAYPTTDAPYAFNIDPPNQLILLNKPVTQVDFVYFLNQPIDVGFFFNFDAGTSAFTDRTDEVNSSTEAPFTLFDNAPATGDIVYIGSSNRFLGLHVNLSTVGIGASTIDWEYWNGTAWTDLTETDDTTGASIFTASGFFTWTFPYGWDTTTVNSASAYWVRGTLTDNYTTDPICATVTIRDGMNLIVEPRDYTFDSYGRLVITGQTVSDGRRNIRVDYRYGMATTPTYITELSVLTAAIKLATQISGGSYDDATSYQLGTKQVGIGEAWVNLKQVISECKARVDEIYNMIGRRVNVEVI